MKPHLPPLPKFLRGKRAELHQPQSLPDQGQVLKSGPQDTEPPAPAAEPQVTDPAKDTEPVAACSDEQQCADVINGMTEGELQEFFNKVEQYKEAAQKDVDVAAKKMNKFFIWLLRNPEKLQELMLERKIKFEHFGLKKSDLKNEIVNNFFNSKEGFDKLLENILEKVKEKVFDDELKYLKLDMEKLKAEAAEAEAEDGSTEPQSVPEKPDIPQLDRNGRLVLPLEAGNKTFRWQQQQMKDDMWREGEGEGSVKGGLVNEQLRQVQEKRDNEPLSKAVISFNIFYKHKYLNKMLKKLIGRDLLNNTEKRTFDVICLQEMCGPWLVSGGDEEDKGFGGGDPMPEPGQRMDRPETVRGRMLDYPEMREFLETITPEEYWKEKENGGDGRYGASGDGNRGQTSLKMYHLEQDAAAESPLYSNEKYHSDGSGFLFKPSDIRMEEHAKGEKAHTWFRSKNTLKKHINTYLDSLRQNGLRDEKGQDANSVDEIIKPGFFNSVEWGKWWLENFRDYTIQAHPQEPEKQPGYVIADFNESSGLEGYSIIFAPANHTNGFLLCSFGNAIIFKTGKKRDGAKLPPNVEVKKILHSDRPISREGPAEGRNALKVKIDGINYICMHLDEQAYWRSQIGMLESWIKKDPQLFEGPCIVCGDMNVMDISIDPIKSIIEENHQNYVVGAGASLDGKVADYHEYHSANSTQEDPSKKVVQGLDADNSERYEVVTPRHPGSATEASAKPEGVLYEVVATAIVSAGSDRNSEELKDKKLTKGQKILVLDRVTLKDGTVRLRFEEGWTSLKTKSGKVLLKKVQGGGSTHKARCNTLWNLFNDLQSIYKHAETNNPQKHIRTVANGGGVDYVGHSPEFEGIQTGVIYPVLPFAEAKNGMPLDLRWRVRMENVLWPDGRNNLLENKWWDEEMPNWGTNNMRDVGGQYCISDHWLPFLVFKRTNQNPTP